MNKGFSAAYAAFRKIEREWASLPEKDLTPTRESRLGQRARTAALACDRGVIRTKADALAAIVFLRAGHGLDEGETILATLGRFVESPG